MSSRLFISIDWHRAFTTVHVPTVTLTQSGQTIHLTTRDMGTAMGLAVSLATTLKLDANEDIVLEDTP